MDLSRRTLLRAAGVSLASPSIRAWQEDARYGLQALLDNSAMARIPAGEFSMGSTNGVADEQPVHRVRIARPFEMGKFEVTQAQWISVMRDPHGPPEAVNPSYFKGPNLPVESVSWNDVQLFLERLNRRTESHEYRLPTEAEWEYACKAGSARLDEVAWYKDNSGERTQPVGLKKPNAWGLYDMQGNVAEWVNDWYAFDYYAESPSADPQGPESGSYRVFRGGGWFNLPNFCRPASRAFDFPINHQSHVGFRVARAAK